MRLNLHNVQAQINKYMPSNIENHRAYLYRRAHWPDVMTMLKQALYWLHVSAVPRRIYCFHKMRIVLFQLFWSINYMSNKFFLLFFFYFKTDIKLVYFFLKLPLIMVTQSNQRIISKRVHPDLFTVWPELGFCWLNIQIVYISHLPAQSHRTVTSGGQFWKEKITDTFFLALITVFGSGLYAL